MKRKHPPIEQAKARAHEIYREKMQQAAGRIFATKNKGKRDIRQENAAAAWLLRFAQMDLEKLPAADKENLRYEIESFIKLNPFSLELNLDYGGMTWVGRRLEDISHEIKELQLWVVGAIRGIHCHILDVNLKSFTLLLVNSQEPDEQPQWTTEVVTIARGDSFKYVAFHLLAREPTRVKICPECKTVFWAAKKLNQIFCGIKCQTKVAMRKHRPPTGRKRGRPPKRQSLKRTRPKRRKGR